MQTKVKPVFFTSSTTKEETTSRQLSCPSSTQGRGPVQPGVQRMQRWEKLRGTTVYEAPDWKSCSNHHVLPLLCHMETRGGEPTRTADLVPLTSHFPASGRCKRRKSIHSSGSPLAFETGASFRTPLASEQALQLHLPDSTCRVFGRRVSKPSI